MSVKDCAYMNLHLYSLFMQPYLHRESNLHSLTPAHVEEVRGLCTECFPISYPDSWYNYITSNKVRLDSIYFVHFDCFRYTRF